MRTRPARLRWTGGALQGGPCLAWHAAVTQESAASLSVSLSSGSATPPIQSDIGSQAGTSGRPCGRQLEQPAAPGPRPVLSCRPPLYRLLAPPCPVCYPNTDSEYTLGPCARPAAQTQSGRGRPSALLLHYARRKAPHTLLPPQTPGSLAAARAASPQVPATGLNGGRRRQEDRGRWEGSSRKSLLQRRRDAMQHPRAAELLKRQQAYTSKGS